ncbi:RNA-directed DNA polymerase, eukaryota, reverse transcriptase zinc-binding domain protein, partial [Tanacetum coccineum]
TTSVRVIKKALDDFSACSGLFPNNSKSRLQLIAAVLESIHVYCASVFLLPALVIKDINRLLKSFLWSQSNTTKGKAKNIAFKKDTLWVKWVDSVKLRGKSIWEISVDQEDKWGWKILLDIRDQIKDKVVYKFGNGANISVWFDNWSEIGSLFQYITYIDLYDERLNSVLKVSDMIGNSKWKWPSEWHHKFPMITRLADPAINADIEDKIVWKTNSRMITDFFVSIVKHDLNRQSLIDSLTTQDKLQKWGNLVVNRCSLCNNDSEDLKHLFFKCSFSADVWNRA